MDCGGGGGNDRDRYHLGVNGWGNPGASFAYLKSKDDRKQAQGVG